MDQQIIDLCDEDDESDQTESSLMLRKQYEKDENVDPISIKNSTFSPTISSHKKSLYSNSRTTSTKSRISSVKKRERPHNISMAKRRSRRGNSSIASLAEAIISNKTVVFITGAGLSVKSGIRPFRGDDGLWTDVVWSNATREAFRRNPLEWYNNFWLKHFPPNHYDTHQYQPNAGHEAIAELSILPTANLYVITQNVDGLHSRTKCKWNWKQRLIEAHGRVGLYKCIPEEDSDTDSSDDDKDRLVKLGNRKKSRALMKEILDREKQVQPEIGLRSLRNKRKRSLPPRKRWCLTESTVEEKKQSSPPSSHLSNNLCRYQVLDSIPVHKIQPLHVQSALTKFSKRAVEQSRKYTFDTNSNVTDDNSTGCSDSLQLDEVPRCLECGNPCPPQALLFDEGYHSHAFYRFMDMEDWITKADALVFVGTSFAVTVTDVALSHAREHFIPVYNFNLENSNCRLESTSRLNVENIMGDASVTLPNLLQVCKEKLGILS